MVDDLFYKNREADNFHNPELQAYSCNVITFRYFWLITLPQDNTLCTAELIFDSM